MAAAGQQCGSEHAGSRLGMAAADGAWEDQHDERGAEILQTRDGRCWISAAHVFGLMSRMRRLKEGHGWSGHLCSR